MTLINKNRMIKLAGLLKEQAMDEWIDEGPNSWGKWVPKEGPLDDRWDSDEPGGVFVEDEEKDVSVYDALNSDEEDESKQCEQCGEEVEDPEISNLCADCSDNPESRFIRGEEYDQELYEGAAPPPVPEKALKTKQPSGDSGLYGEPIQKGKQIPASVNKSLVTQGSSPVVEEQLSPKEYLAGYDESPIDLPDWERDEWGKITDPDFPDDADKEFRQRGWEEQEERHGIDLDNLNDFDNDEDRISNYEDEEGNRHAGGRIKFESLKRIIRNIIREENFADKTAVEGNNKATKSSNKQEKQEKPEEPVNKHGANLSKRKPTLDRENGNYSQPPREPIIPENLRRMIREAVRRQLNEKKKGLPPWLKPGFKNKKKTDDKSCKSDPNSKKKTSSKNKPFFLKKKSKK